MKKIIYILLVPLLIITGCELNNTPTSKVEELLASYQKIDKNIQINYADLSIDNDISDELQERYNKLIKKQYQNLSYDIKDEILDGNTAIITVEIEVKDYKQIINRFSKNNYSNEDYHKLLLDNLESSKDKITYTLEFNVSKENKTWKIDSITEEQRQKLLGIY